MNTSLNSADTIFLERHRQGANLFWPIVLIGAGVILMLTNAGIIRQDPLVLLIHFWPVLLIVWGVEIVFARTGFIGTLVSALLGLAVVAGAIAYLTLPGDAVRPAWLNWSWLPRNTQLRTEHIAQPLDGVRTATVELNLPGGRGSVKPTTDSASANLIEGDVSYPGSLINDVRRSGDTATVRLTNQATNISFFNVFAIGDQRWDVRLNPRVSYDLNMGVGSGTHELDLRNFDLKSVTFDQGSGSTTIRLPEQGQYRFRLQLGSGDANIVLPKGLPIRVNYDIGSGSLSVNDTRRVNGFGQHGVYETDGFSQTGTYIIFDIDIGSGSVTIG